MACFHSPLLAAVLLILILALVASPSASQEDGFKSINCGGANFTDPHTKIVWEEDPFNKYNDDEDELYGRVGNVQSSFTNITREMSTLRSFPSNGRNRKFCYSLNTFIGNTYFVRASFLYGNYDGLNQPPKFVLIFNYGEWTNVSASSSTTPTVHELTFNAEEDKLTICLAPQVNSNYTPFISTLELRLLGSGMYNETIDPNIPSALPSNYGLMLWKRINYGATTDDVIRYPDDQYDRIWEANTSGPPVTTNASTLSSITVQDAEAPPAVVMATAITSLGNLSFTYDGYGGTDGFRMEMHFQEVAQQDPPRKLNLSFPNSSLVFVQLVELPITPATSGPIPVIFDQQAQLPVPFQVTLFPIGGPAPARAPLLNAIELFRWTPGRLSILGTFPNDVLAIILVQQHFNIMGYGQGDPCMPKGFEWTWIVCNKESPPRITKINLPSLNLTGNIPPFISNLTNLQRLDLSHNNLSGPIPPDLNNLLELTFLDVSYNNLCGNLPSFQPLTLANLTFKYAGNTKLCNNGPECQCSSTPTSSSLQGNNKSTRKYIIVIYFMASLYIVLLLIFFVIYTARHIRIKKEKATSAKKQNIKGLDDLKSLPYVTRVFTYNEISAATLNFTTILGQGGFGKVYRGLLSTGEAIAVKLLEDSSRQGLKEFYNEVAILSRVRHKNLVCLLGYCVENTYMLIYEYIEKGNLRDLLYGDVESADKPLQWRTRLHIAFDASQGLAYLHNGCDPIVIHRDVKSSNILLSDKMQAKVADFGLSRLKEADTTITHVSTINVIGTPGYLDPAYNVTNQLTDKSDVYSFGIVLLELICGRAPIDTIDVPPHIVEWAASSIMQGKMEDIVDPTLSNGYKMESMWKVVDVAFGCVENDRNNRPRMSQVSHMLKIALEVEMEETSLPSSKDISESSATSDEKVLDLKYIKNIQMRLEPR